jgi:hypothetical protein
MAGHEHEKREETIWQRTRVGPWHRSAGIASDGRCWPLGDFRLGFVMTQMADLSLNTTTLEMSDNKRRIVKMPTSVDTVCLRRRSYGSDDSKGKRG